MARRRIAVLTGTRAEYGLLYPIMKRIQNHPKLELITMVTGMHLSPQYGLTYRQIEKDGFRIDAKIDMLIDSDTNFANAKAAAIGLYGIAQEIEHLQPDILLVYGDRIEALAAAFAGAMGGIPVAHVQGGDMVHGSNIDDSIRNAITRFAHIHFPVLHSHGQRLFRMGEEKFRIHVVGFPGWEQLQELTDKYSAKVQREIGIRNYEKYFIILFHPTTLESEDSGKQMASILDVVLSFHQKTIVIYPNSDAGGKKIINMINSYAEKSSYIIPIRNLERKQYLALLRNATAIIGNSSSMIFDAPELCVPSVSIGWRQKGRLKHRLIFEVENFDEQKLRLILSKLMRRKNRRIIKRRGQSPSEKIVSVLSSVQINEKLLMKNLAFD